MMKMGKIILSFVCAITIVSGVSLPAQAEEVPLPSSASQDTNAISSPEPTSLPEENEKSDDGGKEPIDTEVPESVEDTDETGIDTASTPEQAEPSAPIASDSAEHISNDLPSISYDVYLNDTGWQETKTSGLTAGSEKGNSAYLEAYHLDSDMVHFQYAAYIQNVGWMDPVSNGQNAGIPGQNLRMEAFKIQLIGAEASQYDIYYRSYSSTLGWLDWACNGQISGTIDLSRSLQALQVVIQPHGTAAPGSTTHPFLEGYLSCSAHVQNYGWLANVNEQETVGTVGEGLRLEAFKLRLIKQPYAGSVEYRAHVQNIGWQGWTRNVSGTTGRALQAEALSIRLTGEMASHYDIYYRAHVQNIGWLDWASNGADAGTTGMSLRLEAFEVRLVEKGTPAPGNTSKPCLSFSVSYRAHVQNIGWQGFVGNDSVAGTTGRALRVEALQMKFTSHGTDGSIAYRVHVQNVGWQDWKTDGDIAGTTGRALQIEAIQIKLTGDASNFMDVWYRVHVENGGWMGWACNGSSAGTEGMCYRVEAIQVIISPKGKSGPGTTANSFQKKDASHVNGWLKSGGLWYHYNGDGYQDAVQPFAPTLYSLPGYYVHPMITGNLNSSNERIEAMIQCAYEYMRTRYLICHSTAPGGAVDCSGLVMQCLYAAGFDPSPATPEHHARRENEWDSRTLYYSTPGIRKVSSSDIRRGDLVWYASRGTIIHVAIALGNGRVIDAWPPRVNDCYPVYYPAHGSIFAVGRPFC